VHTGGAHHGGDVGTVVDHQGDACVSADPQGTLGRLKKRAVVGVLEPELDDRSTAVAKRLDDFEGVAR
jgi:hypothetical protein